MREFLLCILICCLSHLALGQSYYQWQWSPRFPHDGDIESFYDTTVVFAGDSDCVHDYISTFSGMDNGGYGCLVIHDERGCPYTWHREELLCQKCLRKITVKERREFTKAYYDRIEAERKRQAYLDSLEREYRKKAGIPEPEDPWKSFKDWDNGDSTRLAAWTPLTDSIRTFNIDTVSFSDYSITPQKSFYMVTRESLPEELLRLLDEYWAECWADSTALEATDYIIQDANTGKWYLSIEQIPANTKVGGVRAVVRIIGYTHRDPTFPGFMEFLKRKVKP